VRECALVLHGLSQSDREWMLSRMPGERADELRALIDELRTLGLPPDAELTARALHAPQAAWTPTAVSSAPTGAVQFIAAATVAQVQSVLHEEPDSVLAIVASSSAWRWRDRWLSRLEPLRAGRVRKLMLEQATTPALREAVLEAVAQRLRTLDEEQPAAPAALQQRARHWLQQRLEVMPWRR
jgi:hypothetical protein